MSRSTFFARLFMKDGVESVWLAAAHKLERHLVLMNRSQFDCGNSYEVFNKAIDVRILILCPLRYNVLQVGILLTISVETGES